MNAYYVKDLVRGFVKWFIIVMLTLNAILWASVAVRCQEHNNGHKDRKEWEDDIRYRIALITSINGDTIFWKKETKYEVRLASFWYDSTLQVDREWTKKPLGCHQMWYCIKHSFVYMIHRVDDKWCKE